MLTRSAIAIVGYQITEQLYVGSRTLVYRAVRAADQQPVVIKLLKNEYPSFSELVKFRNQYTIAKHLNAPGIIRPYCLEPYHNGYALIMEDFGGISLSQHVRERAESRKHLYLPITDFLAIALQLCDILQELYQQRVIHKDIKPANILIDSDKQVKLIDFSIASLLPRETPEIQISNVLEGTLAYLSPEQTGRMNRGIDYRSDFYSLGVTFYELLTGQLPFVVDDPLELIHCHIAKHPPAVNSLNPEIPPVLSAIVSKLMAKNAENRYQSTFGLKHDLECLAQWQQTGRIEFAIGQRDLCDRFLIPETLHGRHAEVQMLLHAFERVSQGSTEVMLLAGLSGIGKTAVVNEVHKPIVRQRGYFIKGKFDQFQRNIPLSAFVQAFRDLMGQLLRASDRQLEQWKTNILAALGENAQVIIDVIPELERIIGPQPPVPELSGSAAQARFDRLLQQFIQVFTTPAHPLAIFIDDLQWADSASLNLMRLLMGEANTNHLLFIGAYRDNEVTLAHPLLLSLDEMQKSGATVNTMTLAPLTQASVNHLVAATLSCSLTLALPLTALIVDKTGGNPFFTTQFLKALYDDGLIAFNRDENYWECDLAQVRSLTITDDVVAFMATQLQKLPAQTRAILKLAACIGNQFDLNTLAIVSGQTEAETAAVLWEALQEGLVIPQGEVYKFYQGDAVLLTIHRSLLTTHDCSYKFLHDRVQQAAYSLIPDEQKQHTQLQIGRLLLQNTSTADVEANIFKIVGHWNQAIEVIATATETSELARLNLLAGRKAKASAAYPAALSYLQVGIRLLNQTAWRTQYELSLQLHKAAADAAYLSGEFEVAEQLIETILTHARSYPDRVKGYEVRLQSYMAQTRLADALYTGLSILKILGIALPEAPTPEDIQREVGAIASRMGGKSLADLAQLPPMQDAMCMAAMRILVNIIAATYQFAPSLFPLIVCKMMQITIKHGNSPDAAFAYACYGMLMLQQDLESAHSYGQLACQLDSGPHTGDRVRATFVAGSILFHCKIHVREALPFLLRSYQAGLETGNFQFGGYALMNRAQYLYLVGQELTQVRQEMVIASHALTATKQGNTLPWNQSFEQAVLNLLEQSDNPCRLVGTAYDETRSLPQQLAANDRTGLHYVYLNKLILGYLFGQYQSAADNAALAESYLDGVLGFLDGYVFCFYDSLTQLALYDVADDTMRAMTLAKVQANQAQMHAWASHAPMNFQHKYDLVEAERCRVLGQKAEAIDLYDRAIALAIEHEYLNEAALANELAAKFYLNWGKERIAREYLLDAYYGYARWGAKAKVVDLEQRYPHLLPAVLPNSQVTLVATGRDTTHASASKSYTLSSISAALDLETILKASQSISGEIQLEKLLSTLLAIVLENAGADACTLLLLKAGQLLVEATAAVDRPSMVLQALPLEDSQALPLSLIDTVKRTLKPAIIFNATRDAELMADPYILRQQPKSLLCTPILHQGKLLGILYLENNLTSGAFTSDRVKLLNLLCAQAAISLENARLYQQSQQALTELSASKARFEKLADNLPGIIYQIRVAPDGSTSAPYVSSGCAALYEVTPEELMTGKKDFRAMEHPDDRSGIDQAVTSACQTLTPFKHEWRIITPLGTVKWIQAASRPERQADGSIVLDGVKMDISERKQAERQLQESQQLLQLVLNTIPHKVFWKDVNLVYQGCNYSFADVAGVGSPTEIVGKTDYDLAWTTEEADFFRECDRRVMESNTPELGIIEPQLQADGTAAWLETSKLPLHDVDGRVIGLLGIYQNITDRMQAERQLQESQRFLQLLLDSIPQLVFWKDRNSVFQGCNAIAVRRWGLESSADLVGKTDYDFSFTPEEAAWYQECDRRVMDAGQPELHIIETQQQADGSHAWLDTNKIPLRDSEGNVIGILVAIEDISDRKRTEAELRESQHRLSWLIQQSPMAIIEWDTEFRVRSWNLAAEQIFGFTAAEAVGQQLAFLIPEGMQLNVAQLLSQPGGSRSINENLTKSGNVILCDWYNSPVVNEAGEVIGAASMALDITEARRAEDIRRQAEAALQEQEQFLRSIYDGAEMVIFVADVLEDGTFSYAGWNAAAERATGLSSAAIVGKTLTEVLGNEQGEVIRQRFANCVSTGMSIFFEDCLTFNGQETWWFANLNPLKNAEGRVHRLIGTTFDISDRKRAEDQLNQRTAELEQTLQELQRTQTQMVQSEKMSGLGQLVAGVAHEINNPVNFIYGNLSHAAGYTQDLLRLLQLYQQHYPTPHADIQQEIEAIDLEFLTGDLQKLLTSMKVGADRIRLIVASLRNFSRMDESDMKEVNIHEGLDSTLMILQHRLKAKADSPHIEVIKAYGELPLVECYAGQLNQVFMNLLSNAIDALEESLGKGEKGKGHGGSAPTLRITIRTALLDDQQVAIQISDNGVGIPDQVKQRLFDPFFTTKPVGKGTGMGLSISYQIVAERHKGTLHCVSALGEGATFTVTIPIRQR